jgi:hypothetical protein
MQLVEQDETLSTNNQFTKLMGAIVDVDKERYSHVVVSFKKYHIEYSLGVLFTKSTDDEIRTKLDGFAQVLSAHLIECCPGALAPCY